MKKFLFLLFFLFLLSNCANNAVHTTVNKSSINPLSNGFSTKSDDQIWHNFVFFGWFQEKGVDAEKICRNRGGVALTTTEQRWYQSFIASLTFGIYSPRVTYVYCVDGIDSNTGVLESVKKEK